ncbi:MAG: hypothetical protein ABI791_09005 [Acidobacteriota bacterium]
MAEHFIPRETAEGDLLAAAAYLAETIGSADGYAEAMSAVVPLYLKRGDVDTAAELANTVDDSFTRDRLLTQVAEKCAELNDDEYATQLAEAVEDVGLRSEAYERVALKKALAGQFDIARDMASEISHPEFVFAGIAVKQAEDGDAVGANATLNTIEFPNARVHASLEIATAMIAAGNVDAAAAHLENAAVAAAEIEHNEERLRALVDVGNAFIDANRNDRAAETFEKVRSEAETLDNMHRDAFMGAAAVGLFRAGDLKLADRALDLVGDKTQTATCLLGYAREYWRREERSDAMDALEEAYAILKSQRESETRNSKARYALFTSIAAQFAGFEKGERAIEIAHGIEVESDQTAALIQVAEILTLRKEDEQARHALQAIADDANRAFALIRMSDARVKNGDASGAGELLNEAAHLAETVPQLSSRSTAYNAIASRYAAGGEKEKAAEISQTNLRTIGTIRDESRRVTALTEVAELFADADIELSGGLRESVARLLG